MLKPAIFLVIGDMLLAYTAFAFGFVLTKLDVFTVTSIVNGSGYKSLGFAISLIIASFLTGAYTKDRQDQQRKILYVTLTSSVMAFCIISAIAYTFGSAVIAIGHLVASLICFGVLQFFWHSRCKDLMLLAGLQRRVLVIGVGPLALDVANVLLLDKRQDKLVGFLQPKNEGVVVDESHVLGGIEDLFDVIKSHQVNMIVIALSERRGMLPVRELLRCKLSGLLVEDSVTFIEEVTGQLAVESINPSWFIFSSGSRITPTIKFRRRIVDIVFSLIGLTLTLPLYPFITLAVLFDSKGAVFFRQERVRDGERTFSIYKFRTMAADAERNTGAVWAQKDDPRITRVGKFLRKTRLDELPQLINVLLGEMSFVGPRPERPEFVDVLKEQLPYYSNRHFIKPGLTGWAQVKYSYGASVEDALAKLRYDLYYIKNYTIFLDLVIIVETVKVVLFGKGAR